jgi:hypothetical protein
MAVEPHPDEIPAIRKPLSPLSPEGALAAIDAMGRQEEIAKAVKGAGAGYSPVVKGGQERLRQGILEAFARAEEAGHQGVGHDEYEAPDEGHGRGEKRWYAVPYDLGKIRDKDQ